MLWIFVHLASLSVAAHSRNSVRTLSQLFLRQSSLASLPCLRIRFQNSREACQRPEHYPPPAQIFARSLISFLLCISDGRKASQGLTLYTSCEPYLLAATRGRVVDALGNCSNVSCCARSGRCHRHIRMGRVHRPQDPVESSAG